MESLGEKLKEARLGKSYSIDQVSIETHISKRYIEALENEDFTVFPAETYLIGFLRNYSEHLGLDAREMITLYKNMKIQEQPIPMEELIHGKPNIPVSWIGAAAVVVLIVLAAGGFFLANLFSGKKPAAETEKVSDETAAPKGNEYVFKGTDILVNDFKLGDIIKIPVKDEFYSLKIIGISDTVDFQLPDGVLKIRPNQAPQILDVKNADNLVYNIKLNELRLAGKDSRVNLTLFTTKPSQLAAAEVAVEESGVPEFSEETSLEESGSLTARPDENMDETGTTSTSSALPSPETEQPAVAENTAVETLSGDTILSADKPSAFTVSINIRGSCLIRYEMDSGSRVQKYFSKSEEPVVLTGINSRLKIWVSNAGSVRLNINNKEIILGSQGQVASKIIAWTKEETTGTYKLKIITVK